MLLLSPMQYIESGNPYVYNYDSLKILLTYVLTQEELLSMQNSGHTLKLYTYYLLLL